MNDKITSVVDDYFTECIHCGELPDKDQWVYERLSDMVLNGEELIEAAEDGLTED